jgi:hypothetical protein
MSGSSAQHLPSIVAAALGRRYLPSTLSCMAGANIVSRSNITRRPYACLPIAARLFKRPLRLGRAGQRPATSTPDRVG